MAEKKREDKAAQPRPRAPELNPLPGVTGAGAEQNVARPTGGVTGGLFSDPGDGTIGEATRQQRERAASDSGDHYRMTSGTSISPGSDASRAAATEGVNSDLAGELQHGPGAQTSGSLPGRVGADDVGGMGSGTGRGRGASTPGGVGGTGDRAGTGGMGGGFESQAGTGGASGGLGSDLGGGLAGGTGGQGLPRRSDTTSTGGGVAVSGGRGSDVGTVGGGMAPDLDPSTSGGMSGGTFGGSRESDLGGGLSGGMRSGMGADASGGIGDSDDETSTGDRQRNPNRQNPPKK